MYTGEYLEKWLNLRKSALAQRTIEGYRRIIRRCERISEIEIKELTAWDINETIQKDVSAGKIRTAEQIYVLLRTALADAVEMGVLQKTPVHHKLRPKRPKQQLRCWGPEETARFLGEISGHPRELEIKLALMAGLRRGEICGLMWQDIDWRSGIMHIRRQKVWTEDRGVQVTPPKTSAGVRDVPVPEALWGPLRARRQLAGYVTEISASGVSKAVRKAAARAGVKLIGTHGLRHTFATNAVRYGGDMKSLQVVLGHADYATTANIYTHPDEQMIRAVVAKANTNVI